MSSTSDTFRENLSPAWEDVSLNRIRSFINEKRKITLTFMLIPDASRKTRSWRLPLLRIYALVGVATVLMGAAVIAYTWAGSSAAAILHYKHTLHVLAEENAQLKKTTSEQEERLLEMAMETARLAERIVQLQEVAEEIREIVPTASIETPDTLGEVYAVLNGPGEAQGSFIEVLADGEADAAGLSGMGGGELTTEELQMWLQDNLDTLHTVVDQHSHVFTQLKSSAVAYEHRLRHTPSTWPVTGRITSEYGVRRHPITGATQTHTGIDIAVPTGTPVASTAAGRVVHAGPDGGYGLTVVIDHGYGLRTLYAHNSRVLVKVGDVVERGDVIALAGSSGVSTGPHVHYEVHVNGRKVNPRQYLP